MKVCEHNKCIVVYEDHTFNCPVCDEIEDQDRHIAELDERIVSLNSEVEEAMLGEEK